jgi:hypothetical protein
VNKGETISSIVSGRIDGYNGAASDGNADNVPFNTVIHLLESSALLDSSSNVKKTSYFIGASDASDGSRYISYICSNPLTSGKLLWFRNITTAGAALSYAGSHDGDVLYAGRAGGGVSKISGFLNATVKYKADGEEDSLLGLTVKDYNIPGANNIWGIGVDPQNSDHIVATTGGFGAGNKVFESNNGGQTWTAKQGNLNSMPSYSAVIDAKDPKKVYVGTEFGIWVTDDITATSPVWKEANGGIGRVPVFDMKQSDLFQNGCPVIYAATHGRGFFRSVTNTPSACKTDVTTAGINNIISNPTINIFPNPASEKINAQFQANRKGEVVLSIYNVNGQIVKREKAIIRDGVNEVQMDINTLNKGNYFLRIESGSNVYGGSKFIVQ